MSRYVFHLVFQPVEPKGVEYVVYDAHRCVRVAGSATSYVHALKSVADILREAYGFELGARDDVWIEFRTGGAPQRVEFP